MRFGIWVVSVFVWLTGCTIIPQLSDPLPGPPNVVAQTVTSNDEEVAAVPSNEPVVEIKYVDLHLERPPKIRLFFDITLSNERSEPRWFLLPDQLNVDETAAYAVDVIEGYELQGQGRVAATHFGGSQGFQALLLPAGGRVELQRFPILYWGEMPDSVWVEVISVHQLTVGGKPVEAWLDLDLMSDAQATVLADALANQGQVVAVKRMPDYKEVSVAMVEDSRFEFEIDIK